MHLLNICCWVRYQLALLHVCARHRHCGRISHGIYDMQNVKARMRSAGDVGPRTPLECERAPNKHVMGTLASISAAHVAFKAHDNSDPSSLTTCISRYGAASDEDDSTGLFLVRICSHVKPGLRC